MAIFSKIQDFFNRHRNKLLVGGLLVTGSIILTKYAQQRLKEWKEREALEFLERNRKQQHFESIGRTCNQTILNLASALNEATNKAIDTEAIIAELMNNPQNKLEKWDLLKVKVFTKVGCVLYLTVILIVVLKIQLSIVGGYLYKDPNSVTTEMQEQYLSICKNLLSEGVENAANLMENECKKILEHVDLKKQLKLKDLDALFWSLQTAIATNVNNPIEKLKEYMALNDVPSGDDIYSSLIRDTVDLLESDDVKSLATKCINKGFILLGDQISEFYTPNGSKTADFENPFDSKKPMAKLIPIINGLLGNNTFQDQYVQQLILFDKLQALGANVYESFL